MTLDQELLHAAIMAADGQTEKLRLPEEYRLLVRSSYTAAFLSGASMVAGVLTEGALPYTAKEFQAAAERVAIDQGFQRGESPLPPEY